MNKMSLVDNIYYLLSNKMNQQKHHIFTHYDLDGAISLLIMQWMYGADKFDYTAVSNATAVPKLNHHLQKHPEDSLFILDLSLREEFLSFLDKKNVKIFDHHLTTKKYLDKFKQARILYKEENSNSMLLYKNLKECKEKLNDNQKALIKLADDFDGYQLKYSESYDLNIIFWHWYQNRFEDFIKDYQKGFFGFSEKQKKAISFIKQRAEEKASSLPLYEGFITYKGCKLQALATFSEKFSPLIIDHITSKYKPELFFFVNTTTSKVNLRQIKNNQNFDISVFAEEVCDGGGHHDSAGGTLTEPFMEMLKNLKQIK